MLFKYKGEIPKSTLGLMLGFGIENLEPDNIYKDDAEIELFNFFIKKLKDFFFHRTRDNLLKQSKRKRKKSRQKEMV